MPDWACAAFDPSTMEVASDSVAETLPIIWTGTWIGIGIGTDVTGRTDTAGGAAGSLVLLLLSVELPES